LSPTAIYLGAYPIEYYGAERRNAHEHDEVHRLYSALAAEAGIVPEIRVTHPRVAVDELEHEDGSRYVWLVSTSPEPLVVAPILEGAWRLMEVATDEDLTASCPLEPFGIRVARVVTA
jgi:hypothetical protein